MNDQDKNGQSAVFWSAVYGWLEGIDCLGKLGADMDIPCQKIQPNPDGSTTILFHTPLQIAMAMQKANSNYSTVEALLSAGANPNKAFNCNGNPPLHMAVELTRSDLAELLLEKGANPNLVNHKGITPFMMAAMKNNLLIAKMLIGKINIDKPLFLLERLLCFLLS